LPNEVETNVRNLPYKLQADPRTSELSDLRGMKVVGRVMDENVQREGSFGRNRYSFLPGDRAKRSHLREQ
jgi:hypothetical protein